MSVKHAGFPRSQTTDRAMCHTGPASQGAIPVHSLLNSSLFVPVIIIQKMNNSIGDAYLGNKHFF